MVFDTMVFAYALLKTVPFFESAALALESAREVWIPDSLQAEFVNVLWQWVRAKTISPETAHDALRDIHELLTYPVSVDDLWDDALDLAIARVHPAYDTLFIALAAKTGQKVVTFDGGMLLKFPEWTISVSDFIASSRHSH
ncbi:MAG: type II toxin-antitoxin system VapC family toxin [bacterium]